jgi:hypothetical protein
MVECLPSNCEAPECKTQKKKKNQKNPSSLWESGDTEYFFHQTSVQFYPYLLMGRKRFFISNQQTTVTQLINLKVDSIVYKASCFSCVWEGICGTLKIRRLMRWVTLDKFPSVDCSFPICLWKLGVPSWTKDTVEAWIMLYTVRF